jgi:hypothetical protein
MPTSPTAVAPIRMSFRSFNKKPNKARLPGLAIGVMGRYPNGTRIWSFTLEGLLAN